jgi:adenylate cyclase
VNKISQFWQELKRRKVVYFLIGYVVACFAIIEFLDVTSGRFTIPDKMFDLLYIVAACGLPVVFILTWFINKKGISADNGSVKLKGRSYHEASIDPIDPIDPIDIPKQDSDNSIAILPFVNMSNDPEQEYFCDGLSEELVNLLAQIENLNVASRTSAFSFKEKDQDILLIAEKLKVRNILEGSVRKAGSRIRITAQLIDATSGYHIWSEKFDTQIDDIFAIQDEIAQSIANRLNLTFTVDQGDSVLLPDTENIQAYDAYLRGRYLLHRMDTSVYQALEHFQSAIKLDSKFAHAHAGIAATFQALGDLGFVDPAKVSQEGNTALDHALSLNPKLAEAHVTKGWISMFYDWDIVKAEKHFLEALKLDPNSDSAHIRYSAFLSWMLYDHDNAIKEARRAIELNPNENFNHNFLGVAFWVASRYEEAIEQLRHSITIDPNSVHSHYHLGLALKLSKRYDDALKEQKMALEIAKKHPWSLAELGMCYTALDDTQNAQLCFDQLVELSSKVPCSIHLAFLGASMDKIDQAFEFLETAYQSREPWSALVHMHPNCDPLRSDPRFENLIRRIGILPP